MADDASADHRSSWKDHPIAIAAIVCVATTTTIVGLYKEVFIPVLTQRLENENGELKRQIELLKKLPPITEQQRERPAADFNRDQVTGVQNALGLGLAALSPELRARFKLKDPVKGVIITSVESNSEAAERRLSPGDVIMEAAQEALTTPADFERRVNQLKKEGKISLLLLISDSNYELRFVALRIQ